MTTRIILSLAVAVAHLSAPPAWAQVFGTFPWQMQPFCNTVTLTLVATPAGFTLDGTDDQCGGPSRASAVGVASFTAGGDVTLNFTVVTAPSGKPVHVSASVSPANGSGTWSDSVGNSGTFAFFGKMTGLAPRPLPASGLLAASITSAELATGAVTGAKVVDGSLTSADLLDEPRAASIGTGQQIALPATDLILRSISLTAPAFGRVIVNASAQGFTNSTATVDRGQCWIESATTQSPSISFGETGGTGAPTNMSFPLGLTWGFTVAPGTVTATLVCRASAGSVFIINSTMTAMYFPN